MINVEENRKKWIDALRSGDYEQGTEKLCYKGKHCCLGVLCDVYESETGDLLPEDLHGYFVAHENLEELPQVQQWVGLSHVEGRFDKVDGVPERYLTMLNDNYQEYDFNKLADLIESEPKGLFV